MKTGMITDLVQIRLLGEKKRPENERFRRHMKTHDHSDRILRRIAEEIEDQIDCTACANCCRAATVTIADRDVERLARYLRITPATFLADYTEESHDEGADSAAHRGIRLRLPGRQSAARSTMPAPIPASAFRTWCAARLARQPHVAVHRPRLLLPHRLQLAGSI